MNPRVSSYTEWGPLREVIVGSVDGAYLPTREIAVDSAMPPSRRRFLRQNAGKPFPRDLVKRAKAELDAFSTLLEDHDVVVRRPDRVDFSRSFATPDWKVTNGLYAAMPRDLFLVVGNTIIEAPTAWRSRYFEAFAFRSLLLEYFLAGARWVSAPKPRLRAELYRGLRKPNASPSEVEPTFDAADFVRCGRDIFVQRSKVTNRLGIEWVRRELGPSYSIHEIAVRDAHAMHLDATLVPLAPGVMLVNPDRLPDVPRQLRSWRIIRAPRPVQRSRVLLMSSPWISINVLMLDEKHVIVDRAETPLIGCLESNGFQVVTTSLEAFNAFGGSFHCATLDIRREDEPRSYSP